MNKVPIQSLIDHIKTAIDVDPWAKEMAEELLNERKQRNRVEFIESYIKIGDSDYQWSDNHGELVRCRDCKHWIPQGFSGPFNYTFSRCRRIQGEWNADDYCSRAERKDADG